MTPEWYEFEVVSNGMSLGNVGGQVKSEFAEQMIAVLDKKKGTRLGSIQRAQFKQLVGGDDAEYLGSVALSGYNTFYFFISGPDTIHVVLADSEARVLAQSHLDLKVVERWKRALKA